MRYYNINSLFTGAHTSPCPTTPGPRVLVNRPLLRATIAKYPLAREDADKRGLGNAYTRSPSIPCVNSVHGIRFECVPCARVCTTFRVLETVRTRIYQGSSVRRVILMAGRGRC